MSLKSFESQTYSQFSEDGITVTLAGLFDAAPFFVEIGAGNGIQNNTRILAEAGWTGLWIDQGSFEIHPSNVKIISTRVSKDNIVELLSRVPKKFGVLSLDIDGNDYWILYEVLRAGYEPRIIVLEYNSSCGPDVKWTMPYNADHNWNGDKHFGASLAAFAEMLNGLGYMLVGCESSGVNAFFVRGFTAADAYVCGYLIRDERKLS